MYNVYHISPQIVKIKDVKQKEKEMGLRHRLTISMFVDVPEKLLAWFPCCCILIKPDWIGFFSGITPPEALHIIGKVEG